MEGNRTGPSETSPLLLAKRVRVCGRACSQHHDPGTAQVVDNTSCFLLISNQAVVPENGEELFVLAGSLRDELGSYPTHAWVRNPPGFAGRMFARESGLEGCTVWGKTGHLNSPEVGVEE